MSTTPPDTAMNNDSGAERGPGGDPGKAPDSDNSNIPKPKRLACMICRKRKLKCDGIKPSCSTCTRLGHSCAYDEVRRKSGPKRGYVKALEERLKQVETLLKTQEPVASATPESSRVLPASTSTAAPRLNEKAAATANFHVTDPSIGIASSRDVDRWHFNGESPQPGPSLDNFDFNSGMSMNNPANTFTWEMIGLGLEEPLPTQETIDELHQIYFEKVHPSGPMVHKYRYLAAMNLAPNQRPPVCLRYAMWTMACSVTDKYADLKDLFYQRARKYVEADYIKGFGEHMISVGHAQTHILLALYEFKMMYFPRAWMNTGSAIRLCQMMGLHRLDGAGLDVKQCLPPPRDWTEREERRRTFWMAFAEDRYASIGTGWPMTIDEKDVMTNLPASEMAFDMSRPEQTMSLGEAMTPAGAGKLSAFGGIVLMACLFGRNLVHLHRPDVDDRDSDLNGEFWKRHRSMDNILLNTSLCLPSYLKLPAGLSSPNIVFTNMCIHTSTICLHQAAIFKADKNKLPPSVSSESKVRCITAANEIASIMRMISHLDLSTMNPFTAFCLYVAARVFVQYLKSRPDDSQTADSLRFLLAAMNAMKRRNPLTESFLVQLDVDLEALGMRIPKLKSAFPRSSDVLSASVRADMFGKENAPAGAPCTPSENARNGIMAYRNECMFMKVAGDDGNAALGPDIVETEGSNQSNQPSASTDFDGVPSGWLGQETILPHRNMSAGNTPGAAYQMDNLGPMRSSRVFAGVSSGSMSGVGQSESTGTADMSTTSPDGATSDRPTPNSSSASERQNLAQSQRISSSGGNSFQASPAASHQNLTSQSEVERNVAAFFNDPANGFSMGTGLTPDQRFTMPETPGGGGGGEFTMPPGWEMQGGRTAMTPVSEGVLRTIMDLGALEAMDLTWDTNT
ncbi:Fungal specific transcription factor [Pleurostoma richardsiae]|uniref:Fungal specific transcription factor n=1 Tax=Pleurostoma richardsiae TaxID=41990 RepID=A0AA38RVA7_9PEZI|nr:Fungal specific transcription factor [Pleurostoma richardsiae]